MSEENENKEEGNSGEAHHQGDHKKKGWEEEESADLEGGGSEVPKNCLIGLLLLKLVDADGYCQAHKDIIEEGLN
jgi:hypothetical protein